ncbi:MAG: CHAT domain-containing protein [Symploca sp. SIO2E6]|nr:CHAT domain-containing protein [Symploca sp. SIO2E6]
MISNPPVKILFLAADPSNEARSRSQKEYRDIEDKLNLSAQRGFSLEQKLAVRTTEIIQVLLRSKPQIVHFSGHGQRSGNLCFQDEIGKSKPVKPDDLASLFKLVTDQVNCVILNACYTEKQACAIAKHIPFVIGMSQSISDKAAIAFAVGFYSALGAQESVEKAYQSGCVQIRLEGLPEHLTPVFHAQKTVTNFPLEVSEQLQKVNPLCIPSRVEGRKQKPVRQSLARLGFVVAGICSAIVAFNTLDSNTVNFSGDPQNGESVVEESQQEESVTEEPQQEESVAEETQQEESVAEETQQEESVAENPQKTGFNFICTTINNVPVTIVKSEKWEGEGRQLIQWVSNHGEFTPEERCQVFTARFNKYFGQGGRYITHGVINNQKAICTTDKKGNSCTEALFALKPDEDPNLVLENLFALNDRNFAGRPLRM